jgi:hypothetical protein
VLANFHRQPLRGLVQGTEVDWKSHRVGRDGPHHRSRLEANSSLHAHPYLR